MDPEKRKAIEAEFENRFKEAQSLYRQKRYAEALAILNRLNAVAPERKDVIYERNRALKAVGRKPIDKSPERPSILKVSDALFGFWSNTHSSAPLGTPRKIRVRPSSPAQGKDPLTSLESPWSEPEFPPEPSDFVYILTLGCLLCPFLLWALVAVFGEPRPGTTREYAGIEFVWVPTKHVAEAGGESTDIEPGFWISKYEITREQWEGVMDVEYGDGPGPEADYPKRGLRADDCLDFITRLNRKGAGRFRIPTSAEWTRAALAGAEAEFHFGDNAELLPQYALYQGNSDGPTKVGTKNPNRWGLHDVHGNVAEWCADPIDADSEFVVQNFDWTVRGGSAVAPPEQCRVHYFPTVDVGGANAYVGMRLVREPGRGTGRELRALQFPEDDSVGAVFVEGRHLTRAQGEVLVLIDDEVTLVLEEAWIHGLEFLADMRSDALYGFHAPKLHARSEDFGYLGTLTGLRSLRLQGSNVTDSGIRQLRTLTALEHLDLQDTSITDAALPILVRSMELKFLNLENTRISDQDLSLFFRLENLEELNLTGTDVRPENLTELQIALPRCRIIPTPEPPTLEESLRWARVGGKYSMLLAQLEAPGDKESVGYFHEDGYHNMQTYGGYRNLPDGYWVYVFPNWYIWAYTGEERALLDRAWGPERVVGAPDAGQASTDGAVWAPSSESVDGAWLMVEFEYPVVAGWVRIVRRLEPSKLAGITVFDLSGQKTSLSTEHQTTIVDDGKQTLSVYAPALYKDGQRIKFNRLRLEFGVDEPPADNRVAEPKEFIDAIGLEDEVAGLQWASAATSNGFYRQEEAIQRARAKKAQEEELERKAGEFRGLLRVFNHYD